MSSAPRSTEAFDDLIAALTEIRDGYVLNEERFVNPQEVVEAYRYVGQVLSGASEMFAEGDPDFPWFSSIVTPARKLQGDNPDAIYHFARINGGGAYRVTGNMGQACYTSFTVHGVAADGGMAGPLLGDLNNNQFPVDDDGSYELVFSAAKPDGVDEARWVELHADAHAIVVRSYFELEISAQNDPSVSVDIGIAPLEPGTPDRLTDDVFAGRLSEAVGFLRQATVGQNTFGGPSSVPFVSDVPNDVATPFSFRDTGLPVPGAADIVYSMGRWDLGPDEAMVMEGTLPEGVFSNVMLWNVHMQTLEYRNRRSSLNAAQIVTTGDRNYRIVISAKDPGEPNWLDTEGHARGSIFWRFLLPVEDPPKPECSVITL